ncbi:MAG TPA: type IV secretory system conjugative DNA transfer family protein, partial [Bacillota bacterium]|nr:type IV secretory system conjugative DNA transfer family protein [Bacillota bacterium]
MNKTISRLWFLRRVLIAATLPGYFFFIFHLKCIVGMFNCTIRAIWFKYLVQREDIFYMRMFVGLALIYLNILVIKPLPVFDKYFGPRIPGYDVFAWNIQVGWGYLKWWYMVTSFIAAPFALADEFLFKPLYVTYVLKPSASRERLAYRENARLKNSVFSGTDSKSGKPLYITDEMRSLHCHLLGTTGSGKTESVIFPMLFQDICRGRGAIIVDAKSEIKFFKKIYTYHLRENPTEKKQEIYIVNLGNPEFSNTYNPLLRGNAVELKDRIMGSLVWSEVFYKKKAEEILLVLFLALESIKKRVTFRDLYILLTVKAAVKY